MSSRLIQAREALIRFHENVEYDGYFYGNAQQLIDELNELFDVKPAPVPVVRAKDEFK